MPLPSTGMLDAYPLNYNISLVNTTSTCGSGTARTVAASTYLWQLIDIPTPRRDAFNQSQLDFGPTSGRRTPRTSPFSLNVSRSRRACSCSGWRSLACGHGASGMNLLWRHVVAYELFRMKLLRKKCWQPGWAAAGGIVGCCHSALHNSDRRKMSINARRCSMLSGRCCRAPIPTSRTIAPCAGCRVEILSVGSNGVAHVAIWTGRERGRHIRSQRSLGRAILIVSHTAASSQPRSLRRPPMARRFTHVCSMANHNQATAWGQRKFDAGTVVMDLSLWNVASDRELRGCPHSCLVCVAALTRAYLRSIGGGERRG